MSNDRDGPAERLDPAAVRDRIEERIDADAVRERIDERVDVDAVRDRVVDALDPAVIRSRLDDFYARYFLPPTVTGEVEADADEPVGEDVAPFDFGAWLEEGRGSGAAEPPAEPRVVTEAAAPAVDPDADFGSFDFEAWLTEGEEFEPIDVLEPDTVEPSGDVASEADPADGPLLRRPTVGIHPAKAATYALFLAVVAVLALTVGGHLPALGPTGLAG